MYINIYKYKKSFWGKDIEIFNDETKWGYVSWNGLLKTTAIGDLYGKKYQLSVSSSFPLKFKVMDEAKTEEIANLKFNIWCTKGRLRIKDGSEYQLHSIHHFTSKYIWKKNGAQVMRINNGFMGGEIESSVTDEEHNALMLLTALYINNHITATIILTLIVIYLLFE